MTNHRQRTARERQALRSWKLSSMLMGVLALSAAESRAQSMNLDVERRGHPTTVSTETHGAYGEFSNA